MLYVDERMILKWNNIVLLLEYLATINRQYHLLSKDESFNGYNQAIVVNRTDFSGHFNDEFRIRMIMKHFHDKDSKSSDKEHIFCKADQKCKTKKGKKCKF